MNHSFEQDPWLVNLRCKFWGKCPCTLSSHHILYNLDVCHGLTPFFSVSSLGHLDTIIYCVCFRSSWPGWTWPWPWFTRSSWPMWHGVSGSRFRSPWHLSYYFSGSWWWSGSWSWSLVSSASPLQPIMLASPGFQLSSFLSPVLSFHIPLQGCGWIGTFKVLFDVFGMQLTDCQHILLKVKIHPTIEDTIL